MNLLFCWIHTFIEFKLLSEFTFFRELTIFSKFTLFRESKFSVKSHFSVKIANCKFWGTFSVPKKILENGWNFIFDTFFNTRYGCIFAHRVLYFRVQIDDFSFLFFPLFPLTPAPIKHLAKGEWIWTPMDFMVILSTVVLDPSKQPKEQMIFIGDH